MGFWIWMIEIYDENEFIHLLIQQLYIIRYCGIKPRVTIVHKT